MIYINGLDSIEDILGEVLYAVCKGDSKLDFTLIQRVNLQQSISRVAHYRGLHGPMAMRSTIGQSAADNQRYSENINPREDFCKSELIRYKTTTIKGRKFIIPLEDMKCPIIAYGTHVLMQPETFAIGHDALKVKEALYDRRVRCIIDDSFLG